MFLRYAENVKWYRVFDLNASKTKVVRSIRLDEREMDGIYEMQPAQNGNVIHVNGDAHGTVIPDTEERQTTVEEPMDGVDNDTPDVNTKSVKLGHNPVPPLLFEVERPAPTGMELTYQTGSDSKNGSTWRLLSEPSSTRVDGDAVVIHVPTTYAKALTSNEAAHWCEVIDAAPLSHGRNGTWTLVPRGTGNRTNGGRWIFAHKRGQYGRVARYSARLVAKGFKQNTVLSSLKHTLLWRTYTRFKLYRPPLCTDRLSVCAIYECQTEWLDAFLNSDLMDHAYMEVSFGIENANEYECQFNKVIYGLKHTSGLKQAANVWNKIIHHVFLINVFKSCGADQCVYVKRSGNGYIYVCPYVDDIIIAAKTKEAIRGVKDALKNTFKMKELGQAKFILGWRSITASRLEP
ncbi:unnamed protein product [Phytophthora fragariaefolia]|uniref:Unnamed protein product n=1 Tax=Phytophthora fragariaefolia TaxID=1490495 RepID=A0A9W6U9S0_9STRA|nr:unnamed protein product [Phytophthora fragariaefolia]